MKRIILSVIVLIIVTVGYNQQLIESFETGTFPPVNWTESHTGGAASGLSLSLIHAQEGSASAAFYLGDTTILHTPVINNLAAGSELTFWEYQEFPWWYSYHGVFISINGSVFYKLADLGAGTNFSWDKRTLDLSLYAGYNIQLAFLYKGYSGDKWWIDNIKVDLIPTCPAPSALATTLISTDSVKIYWTENAGATSWYVEYGVSPLTPGTGTKILTNKPDTLTGLSGATDYQYYVKSICAPGDSSVWVGPHSFTTPANCPAPSALTATLISADSVKIDWTENAGATSWQVEYGVSPLTLGTGTKITTTKRDTLTGLFGITTYDYYVKSICGAGDSSTWSGPYSFTTGCPISFSVPYSEDFTSFAPSCWNEATGILETNTTLSLGSSDWKAGNFGGEIVASKAASVNIYDNNQYDWLLTPVINLENTISYQAEFDIALTTYQTSNTGVLDTDDTVAFVISIDGGATWSSTNILELWNSSNNTLTASGIHVIVDLTAYSGEVMFGFYGASSTRFVLDNDLYIDNFKVDAIPSCPTPSNLLAKHITSTTLTLAWTKGGVATEWEVKYGTTGNTAGNLNLTLTDSLNITGLTPQSTYDFYVRAICSPGDSSLWYGPFTFTTPCDAVTGDSINNAILISGLTYTNTIDNNCYTNQYIGRDGNDVVYKIALDSCIDSLILSTCASGYDTYLYVLKDDQSTVVAFNDDANAICGNNGKSYLELTTANFNGGDTLYIVVDGYITSSLGFAVLDVEQILRTTSDASFSYVTGLCSGDSAMVSVTGLDGGLFTAQLGLNVDDVTGKVIGNNAGTYEVYYTVGGNTCANTDTTTIIVDSIDYSITMNADTAFAVVGAASYQWLDCSAGDTVITGATNSWYKAPVSGDYSVIISGTNCTGDTSACVTIATTSTIQLSTINFNMFPNPNNGDFVITTKGNEKDLTVDVMNTVGQVVYSTKLTTNSTNINLNNVAKGSYIVRIYNNNSSTQEILIVK
jgi:hypothetical protein